MTKRHFLLHPVGSAGDVFPFIGLGSELHKRGHRVTLLTSGYFRDAIENAGLDFAEVQTREEFLKVAANPDVWKPHKGAATLFKSMSASLFRRVYDAIVEIRSERSVLVAPCLGFAAKIASEKMSIPFASIALQPALLWSNFDTPKIRGIWTSAPNWFKRIQYWAAERILLNPNILPVVNQFRQGIGLNRIRSITNWWLSKQLILCLFPEWYASRQPDWPTQVRFSTFPVWDEGAESHLPENIVDFLAAGTPPILFTPGSANMHGRRFFEAARTACQNLGARAIFVSKFTDHLPSNLPLEIKHVRYAPFSNLLPNCSAVVHHGGIGTMARGFQAGIPQLIMPLTYDQPDNARRIRQHGVGDFIEPKDFTPDLVARRLSDLLNDKAVKSTSKQIKQRFQNLNPFDEACNILESTFTAT